VKGIQNDERSSMTGREVMGKSPVRTRNVVLDKNPRHRQLSCHTENRAGKMAQTVLV
jgi:hypothetical protein